MNEIQVPVWGKGQSGVSCWDSHSHPRSQGTALLHTEQRSFLFSDPAGASQRPKIEGTEGREGGSSGRNTQVPPQVTGTVIEPFLRLAGTTPMTLGTASIISLIAAPGKTPRFPWSSLLRAYSPLCPLAGSDNPPGGLWLRASYPRPSPEWRWTEVRSVKRTHFW